MTPEEMDRKMEFIVEQQAQFVVRIDKLLESQERLHQSDERLRESHERLRDSQATLTASLLRVVDIVQRVVDIVQALSQAQKSTDERLNALISVVEKHITGPDHGRKPQ